MIKLTAAPQVILGCKCPVDPDGEGDVLRIHNILIELLDNIIPHFIRQRDIRIQKKGVSLKQNVRGILPVLLPGTVGVDLACLTVFKPVFYVRILRPEPFFVFQIYRHIRINLQQAHSKSGGAVYLACPFHIFVRHDKFQNAVKPLRSIKFVQSPFDLP